MTSPTTQFTVTIVYSNGTTAQATLYGVSVSNSDLADNAAIARSSKKATPASNHYAKSTNAHIDQAIAEMAGKFPGASNTRSNSVLNRLMVIASDHSKAIDVDGYQDVDILPSGLNTSSNVTQVALTAPGIASQYNAPFGSNNSAPKWLGSTIAIHRLSRVQQRDDHAVDDESKLS